MRNDFIIVEDPSDNFQRVRTFVDTKNCLKLKVFQKDQLKEGFTHDMVHEARNKLKLSKVGHFHKYHYQYCIPCFFFFADTFLLSVVQFSKFVELFFAYLRFLTTSIHIWTRYIEELHVAIFFCNSLHIFTFWWNTVLRDPIPVLLGRYCPHKARDIITVLNREMALAKRHTRERKMVQ